LQPVHILFGVKSGHKFSSVLNRFLLLCTCIFYWLKTWS